MTKEVFTERITAMTKTLYRVSCGLLCSEADREDAVQETILRAWEKLPTLREEAYFETWVVRILINECRSIGRQRKRAVSLEEHPIRDAGQPPETRLLRDAIQALSEEYRLAVVLHYIEGYGVREIADLLGIPTGTVKSRLHRAREALKLILGEVQEL